MAYSRLNLKDFDQDNPFAAKHVTHLEDGIVQNESDIKSNTDLIDRSLSAFYAESISDLYEQMRELSDYQGKPVYLGNSAMNEIYSGFNSTGRGYGIKQSSDIMNFIVTTGSYGCSAICTFRIQSGNIVGCYRFDGTSLS